MARYGAEPELLKEGERCAEDLATQLQEGEPLSVWQVQQVQQLLDEFQARALSYQKMPLPFPIRRMLIVGVLREAGLRGCGIRRIKRGVFKTRSAYLPSNV